METKTVERLMVDGLRHKYAGLSDAEFFAEIDAHGGWPNGYRYVGFEHADARAAGFTNSHSNTGWWTVLAEADDYYLWKLSPAALQRVVDGVISALTIPRVNAQKLSIRNSRGRQATLTKAEA